jgi:hypothetical protein
MVTGAHEARHRVFRHVDDLLPEVMDRVFGVALGKAGRVTVLSTDLTEPEPLERRPDSVILAELLVQDDDGTYIVVVESQTSEDRDKPWSWPYYIAYLREKYRYPVLLLVVCSDPVTERWARKEIISGVGDLVCMRVTPAVAGPGNVEPITDLDMARQHVGFAVFSALTHSRMESPHDILEVLPEALGTIEQDNGEFLAEFVEAGLAGTNSYAIWRDLMITGTYPHVSQWRTQATEQGSVKARTEDILRILVRRDINVPEDDRMVIENCADMDTLDKWFDRALAINDIKDLFTE